MTIFRCATCRMTWGKGDSKYATDSDNEKHAAWCRDKPRTERPY